MNVFHFAIVEDREVFPRYELTGLGNSGFAGQETICDRLGPGDERASGHPCLMGGDSITNARGVSNVFCMRVRWGRKGIAELSLIVSQPGGLQDSSRWS